MIADDRRRHQIREAMDFAAGFLEMVEWDDPASEEHAGNIVRALKEALAALEGSQAIVAQLQQENRPLLSTVPPLTTINIDATLRWACECALNAERIAATKTGSDREGWVDDLAHWRDIVRVLDAVRRDRPPAPPESSQ